MRLMHDHYSSKALLFGMPPKKEFKIIFLIECHEFTNFF